MKAETISMRSYKTIKDEKKPFYQYRLQRNVRMLVDMIGFRVIVFENRAFMNW